MSNRINEVKTQECRELLLTLNDILESSIKMTYTMFGAENADELAEKLDGVPFGNESINLTFKSMDYIADMVMALDAKWSEQNEKLDKIISMLESNETR